MTGSDVDCVLGKAALREYWTQALSAARDLYFAIDRVFTGSDALTIEYTNHRSQSVCETFVFNREGKVRLSVAAYA